MVKQQTGLWIDGSRAIIVTFINGTDKGIKMVEADIENKVHNNSDDSDKGTFMGGQHISHEKTFDERKKHQIKDYLSDVVQQLSEGSELFIFGPGEMKNKLVNKIKDENNILKLEVKSIDTTDKMTDNQIVAYVKEFYGISK
ncbi:MAG: hypothetical protein ACN6I4_01585 [bacterium]